MINFSNNKKSRDARTPGLIYAISAYFMWGFFPLYFYLLKFADPLAVLCHRIVWSVCFLSLLISVQKRWIEVRAAFKQRKTITLLAITSLLISVNWLIFTWAAANGHVIEGSLGYLISPLFSLSLGVIFLNETLTRQQCLSIGIVGIGIGIAVIGYGRLPWVAISLAVSFSAYGFLRKMVNIKSQPGLMIETTFVFLPALFYLLIIDSGQFLQANIHRDVLLLLVGLITVLPLISLGASLPLLSMRDIGMLQYLTPIMQFLCGLIILNEAFNAAQGISFGFIIIGLIIFSLPVIRRK